MSDEASATSPSTTAPNSPAKGGGGLPPSVRSSTYTAGTTSTTMNSKSSPPHNATNNTSAPPRAPLPSTPARDPASLVAKRMQNLQLHGGGTTSAMHLSPLPSSALFMAGSPLRSVAITPSRPPSNHHRYDLTPVMKNTSTAELQLEATAAAMGHHHHHAPVPPHTSRAPVQEELDFDLDKLVDDTTSHTAARTLNVVSPDASGGTDGLLQGEHLLALPDDLCKTSSSIFAAGSGGGNGGGPNKHPLPSLAKRGSLPVTVAQRRGSTGTDWHFAAAQAPRSHPHPSEVASTTPDRMTTIQITGTPKAPIRAPELAFFPEEMEMMEEPFPLAAGKSNTFTCREQYEKQIQSQSSTQEQGTNNHTAGLKPYQPSRQDPELGLNEIPPEELNRIFTPRRNGNGSAANTSAAALNPNNRSDSNNIEANGTFSSTGGPTTTTTTTSSEDADEFPYSVQQQQQQQQQHMLFAPIPLDERQWSIPSIRMANQLGGGGGSVTSCTTYTDEDDESFLYYKDAADDASLDSVGSYIGNNGGNVVTLGGGQDVISSAPFVVAVTPQKGEQQQQQPGSFDSHEPQPPFEWLRQEHQDPGQYHANTNANFAQAFAPRGEERAAAATLPKEVTTPAARVGGDDTEDDIMILPPTTQSRYHQRRRRQKRKEQRDRQAYEWLRTVKAGKDEVDEAASSKFLTGRTSQNNATTNYSTPSLMLEDTHQRPFKRLSAAAVMDTTAAFAFPPTPQNSCMEEDTGNMKMLATS